MLYTRKNFLKNLLITGSIFSIAQFKSEILAYGKEDINFHRNDPFSYAESLGFYSTLEKILITAILAPNSHNTQPWKIRVDAENSFSLFVDTTKQLPEIDPINRQLFHTQGTFLELAKLAAGALGYDAKVSLFPKGNPNASSKGLSDLPVAKFEIKKSTSIPDPIFSGLKNRRMNRSIYSEDWIGKSDQAEILKLVGPTKHKILFVLGEESVVPLFPFFIESFAMETHRTISNELNRNWFRVTDEEIYSNRDGLTLEANGLSGFKLWFVKNFFLDRTYEGWHSQSGKQAGIDIFKDQVQSSKGFVFFITDTKDSEREWIEVGMDFMRITLACSLQNIAFHTMNQALEDYPESKNFHKKLAEHLNLKKGETIQLAARLGRSNYSFNSPRKNLPDFLL